MSRNPRTRVHNPQLDNVQVINRHTFGGPRDASYIYIGRGTPLGNNWSHIPGTQAQYHVATREIAIDQYRHWLWNEMKSGKGPVVALLNQLKERATQGEKLNLACSCFPEACHGDVIKGAIEHLVQQDRGQSANAVRNVFVSGSRSLTTLTPAATSALDRLMSEGANILIGDAHGADRLAQQYLAQANYDRVQVFHIGNEPRNNEGFPTVKVEGSRQTDKDAYMAQQATEGLALWDGKSPGTQQNIDRVPTTVINCAPEKDVRLSARAEQARADVFAQDPSENLRSLYNVDEGLTRGEHASQLNRTDQFVRDNFEHGATINDSILSIPVDPDSRPLDAEKVTIGTEAHAIDFVRSFIDDPQQAVEKGQRLFTLAEKACGQWTDSNGRLAIFRHVYDNIRKDENGRYRSKDERAAAIDKALDQTAQWTQELPEPQPEPTADEVHERILALAEENRAQGQQPEEPEHLGDVDLHHALYLQELGSNSHGLATLGELAGLTVSSPDVATAVDENQLYADIFEQGLVDEAEFAIPEGDHLGAERQPSGGYSLDSTFDRIDLDRMPPAIPDRLTSETRSELISEILPRVDAQVDRGFSKREILSTIYDANRNLQSSRFDERITQLFGQPNPAPATRGDRLTSLSSLRLLVAGEYQHETRGFSPQAIAWAKENYQQDPDRLRADGKLKVYEQDGVVVSEYRELKASQDAARSEWIAAHSGQAVPNRAQTACIRSLETAGWKISNRIAALNPTNAELARALDTINARLQSATLTTEQLLTRYEQAEASARHLEQAARQYADHVRSTPEFQAAKTNFDRNNHERALDQRQELIRGNSARFDYLQQGDGTRAHASSQHAELKWSGNYDRNQEAGRLSGMLASPEIETAQRQLSEELQSHRTFFTQLAGHEISSAQEARNALNPTLAGLERTTHLTEVTRGRFNNIPPTEIVSEHLPAPVYVSLTGSEALRVPVASLPEYESMMTAVTDCRLHTSSFSSLFTPVAVTGRDEERDDLARFVSEYIDFRLTDHATNQMARNPRFRDYSQRLGDSRSVEELVETSTAIRTENYQAFQQAQAHQADPNSPGPALAPLTVGEMREVFLSVSPIAATREERDQMKAVLQSMTIFGQEKAERVKLLAEGKIQPSPMLAKLLDNLASRNTRPALQHFYRSLRNPAETLTTKNTFDLYKAHTSLPQYERDYLNNHAIAAKYEQINQARTQTAAPAPQQPTVAPVNAVAQSTDHSLAAQTDFYREYYGTADWLEARAVSEAQALHEGLSAAALHNSTIVPELNDLDVRAINHVIHNFDSDRQALVVDHLSNSGNDKSTAIADMIRVTSEIQDGTANHDLRDFNVELSEDHPLSPSSVHQIIDYTHREKAIVTLSPPNLSQIQTEAQASAWANVKESALPSTLNLVDAPASTLQTARDLHSSIDRTAQLQDRARTAHDIRASHLESLTATAEQAVARSDYNFSTTTIPAEHRTETVRSLVTAVIKNETPAPELSHQFEVVKGTLNQTDIAKASDLDRYAASARTDYLNSFATVDADKKEISRTVPLVQPSHTLEELPAAARYEATANQIETSILNDHAHALANSTAPLPDLANGQIDNLTVRDLLPADVRLSAHQEAKEFAWQSFAPPELAASREGHAIDERILNTASSVMDKVETAETLQLQVDIAREKLESFVNARMVQAEKPVREERAAAAFETKFREAITEIKTQATNSQSEEKAQSASNLLQQLEQTDFRASTLVASAQKGELQPLQVEIVQTANAAASAHAREVDRTPLYASIEERQEAHVNALSQLSVRDAERHKELKGQHTAAATKFEQSFSGIDDRLATLADTRMNVQIEREVAQFEQIAKPASVVINNYLKDTVTEHGYNAVLDPANREQHVDRIATAFQEVATAKGIALEQSTEQLNTIASNLFNNITPALERASEQAHAHDPQFQFTIAQPLDLTQSATAAHQAFNGNGNGLNHLPEQQQQFGELAKGHNHQHQPILPGDSLTLADKDMNSPSALAQTPATANSPATTGAAASAQIAQNTEITAAAEEMAIAL